MRFPIVIHKDRNSAYGVTVTDLPSCFSASDTLDNAIDSAHEAVARHLEGLLLDGETIPEQASLEAHRANKEYRGGTGTLVSIDISKLSSKAKRANITIPAWVLAIMNEAAAREGETRSGFLVRAALSYVERHSIKPCIFQQKACSGAIVMATT